MHREEFVSVSGGERKGKAGEMRVEGWGIYPRVPVQGPWFMQVAPAMSCRKVEIAL